MVAWTTFRTFRASVVLGLLSASAAVGCVSELEPDERLKTSSDRLSLAPATSPLADAVDSRCATAFTAADRTAIETAVRASDLSAADRTSHALNRLGFGDRFAGVAVTADPSASIALQVYQSLVAGGSIPAAARTAMKTALPTLARPSGDFHYDFRQLYVNRDAARAAGDAATAAAYDAQITLMRDTTLDELAGKQIMGAALSPDIALGEHQTSFWLNHFNVDGRKVSIWAPGYEWIIRTNLCGTFDGMLKEVARSPAMLKYLDNYMSVAPGSNHWTGATNINENYARELLELHTLGTGPRTTTNTSSPYTQADVVQVALTLTGWSYSYATDQRSTFFKFFPEYHAAGTKAVMGTSYVAGEAGGLTLLTNLANHASTKAFICNRLAGHFFTATPPAAVVNACVASWGVGGVLSRMMVAILARPETWKAANFGNKIKSPLELVVSSHRLSADDETTLTASRVKSATLAAQRMGLWLWRIDEPTGYTRNHLDWLDASYIDEQLRYLYGESDPAGLDINVSGTVLTGAGLENYFMTLASSSALTTARTKVIPTRGLPFANLFDTAFLETAFSSPDLAPGTTAPQRPVRSLLTLYASSWQFLLK